MTQPFCVPEEFLKGFIRAGSEGWQGLLPKADGGSRFTILYLGYLQKQGELWARARTGVTGQPVEPVISPARGDRRFGALCAGGFRRRAEQRRDQRLPYGIGVLCDLPKDGDRRLRGVITDDAGDLDELCVGQRVDMRGDRHQRSSPRKADIRSLVNLASENLRARLAESVAFSDRVGVGHDQVDGREVEMLS